MNKLNLNDKNSKDKMYKVVTVMGMITIMFYMILSLRNIFQVLVNFSLLSAHSAVAGIILNIILYLFIVVIGFEAIRKSKNPYYQILVLIAILIIY